MGDTCRLCPAPATAVDVFVLDHNDARVEHATCAAHRVGLREEMLAAGWKQLPPADAAPLAEKAQKHSGQRDRCRDYAHHADGTGYFDPNGHEITADRWHEALGLCVACAQKPTHCRCPKGDDRG